MCFEVKSKQILQTSQKLLNFIKFPSGREACQLAIQMLYPILIDQNKAWHRTIPFCNCFHSLKVNRCILGIAKKSVSAGVTMNFVF